MKMLSKIINARVVEIIEQVYLEIKNYGYNENKKKLIAGIVLTGGGSELKHIKQLVEFVTGMDTRIGYPNEHLASNSSEDLSSPIYATAVGLILKGLETKPKDRPSEAELAANAQETENLEEQAETDSTEKNENTTTAESEEANAEPDENEDDKKKPYRSKVFENWANKFRNFLNEDL
jgi:cell division protein FtsA